MQIATQGIDEIAVGENGADAIVFLVENGGADNDAPFDAVRRPKLIFWAVAYRADVRYGIHALVEDQRPRIERRKGGGLVAVGGETDVMIGVAAGQF